MRALAIRDDDLICTTYGEPASHDVDRVPSRELWRVPQAGVRNKSVQVTDKNVVTFTDTCDLSALWAEMQDKWTLCASKIDFQVAYIAHELPRESIKEASISLTDSQIEAQFNKLSAQWKRDTQAQSGVSAIVMHPAYLDIIGMGDKAVPLILRDLKKETSHWFIALRAITKSSPVRPEDAGNLKKMRDAWLKWGKENGFLE